MTDHHETPPQTKHLVVTTHGEALRSPPQNRAPSEPSPLDNLLTLDEGVFWTVSRYMARLAASMRVPLCDIDDLVEEAWLSVFEHRSLFKGVNLQRLLYCWMRKVIHDLAIDLLRHLHSCPCQSLSDEAIEPSDAMAAKRAYVVELHESLDALLAEASRGNEENLFLLRAHFFHGVSNRELAQQFGVTINALNGRIQRLLKRMRERAKKKFQHQSQY